MNQRREAKELLEKRGDRPPFCVRRNIALCKMKIPTYGKYKKFDDDGSQTARGSNNKKVVDGSGKRPQSAPNRRRQIEARQALDAERPPWRPSQPPKKGYDPKRFPKYMPWSKETVIKKKKKMMTMMATNLDHGYHVVGPNPVYHLLLH